MVNQCTIESGQVPRCEVCGSEAELVVGWCSTCRDTYPHGYNEHCKKNNTSTYISSERMLFELFGKPDKVLHPSGGEVLLVGTPKRGNR